MYKVQNFGLILWFGLHIMLSFAEENDQADVFKHCVNSTNSTSCSFTYEHVYNSLTKNESNFNISYALYPDGAKPSFLVRVNVYGPNRTSNSIPAKFTWSIHCLYANVPAWPLQILSLFSITVTSRTQELNIKVPSFCCNMSDDKKEREEMIQEFLTRTIFELQDLAMSPAIRDPSLNTAECVIKGHDPNFEAKGRSLYIRAVLGLSLIFVIISGPLLAKYVRDLEEQSKDNNCKKKNTVKAVCFSFYILSIPGSLLIIVALVLSIVYRGTDIIAVLALIIVVSLGEFTLMMLYMYKIRDPSKVKNCSCFLKTFKFRNFLCFLKIFGGHAISYIFCWIVTGIRINPTWGLTIALLVISLFAAVTYARYLYLENFPKDSKKPILECLTAIAFLTCCCLAVLIIFLIVIFAGHSGSEKEMGVDEVLKTTSLYFITAFITWVTWKTKNTIILLQNDNTPSVPGPSSLGGSIQRRPGENLPLFEQT